MSGRDSRRPGDDDLPRETAVPADPDLTAEPDLTADDAADADEDEPPAEAGFDDDELSALEAAAVLGGTVDITLPAGFAEERADRLLANAAPTIISTDANNDARQRAQTMGLCIAHRCA